MTKYITMNNKYFSSILAVFVFLGCGSNISENENKNESNEKAEITEEKTIKPEIDMDGPILEVNVLSFDLENNKTQIEIINRSEYDIVDIRGKMIFIDSDGNEITWSNGRRKESPFQRVANPQIVKAKSKRTLVLLNKIQKGTAKIIIDEFSGDTRGGGKIEP